MKAVGKHRALIDFTQRVMIGLGGLCCIGPWARPFIL